MEWHREAEQEVEEEEAEEEDCVTEARKNTGTVMVCKKTSNKTFPG
jgi:hypothetical protein